MKKVLVLLIAFAIVGGVALFAEPVGGSPKTLDVFGYIPSPEKAVTLLVESTLPSTGINLLGDDDVQSDGAGAKIGTWTLKTDAHDGDETYILTYEFGDLISADTSQSIGYTVFEHTGSNPDVISEKSNGGSSTLEPLGGDTSFTRTLKVKLASDPSSLAPADDFTSTITLTLTSGS